MKGSYYRGYLIVYDENDQTCVFINNIDVKTNKRYAFAVQFKENNKKELEILSIQPPKEMNDEIKNDLNQSITDIFNFDAMYRANESKITYDSNLEDKWDEFGYSLYYHYSKVTPVFKFDTIAFNSPEGPVFYAACKYGMIINSDYESFFNANPRLFQTPAKREANNKIPEAAPLKVKLNGFEVNLDENWKENEITDGPVKNTGMWLQVDSIRDAQIMIEKMPSQFPFKTIKDKEEFITYALLLSPNVIPSTVSVEKKGQDLYLTYANYDEHDWVTFNINRMSKGCVVNFSSFLDMYMLAQQTLF